jgi:hypothetical protein
MRQYVSATAFSTYESTVTDMPQPSSASASNNNGRSGTSNNGTTYPSASSQQQEEKSLTSKGAKAVIVELLDPYNITHLRAWEEVRKIAAEQISSPTSVLNSFFTPTVFISAIGGFGLGLYISVQVLFLQQADGVSGPFFTAAIALSVIFLGYLILVYTSARATRRHFKIHETIVSRIAFDVARELEHSVRRTQLGLEYLATDDDGNNNEKNTVGMTNNNNASDSLLLYGLKGTASSPLSNNTNNNGGASPFSGGGGGTASPSSPRGGAGDTFGTQVMTPQYLAKLLQQQGGKANFCHEPPATESELSSLFESVNSLCNMMSVATPRPLFIGMEQRNVRYFLAYILAIIALLLFFALLTSMRKGYCKSNLPELPQQSNSTTSAPAAASMMMKFLFL